MSAVGDLLNEKLGSVPEVTRVFASQHPGLWSVLIVCKNDPVARQTVSDRCNEILGHCWG